VLIGEQGARIEVALKQIGFTDTITGGSTMADIVATAQAQAKPGDVVLLSTACASFDMFKNYQDRGEQFQAAAKTLI
jgi:UDP-N-acetylmuramoylalanine--D-glutamate ligase